MSVLDERMRLKSDYASRVTRTASRLSTISNSLQASCRSPEDNGRSSPCPHRVSITSPGTRASRLRTRKSRTGTTTSSSTGKRANRGDRRSAAISEPSSGTVVWGTKPARGEPASPRPEFIEGLCGLADPMVKPGTEPGTGPEAKPGATPTCRPGMVPAGGAGAAY